MKFLDDLDNDLRFALLAQLRDLWTHNSTALEGNTLTLGETAFILSEGLTVSGKSLREHQEVAGHARAIELLYDLLKQDKPITEQNLFTLHQAVQTSIVVDIYQPIGAWKCEPNGTYALTSDNKQTFIDYAAPSDVPALMTEWLVMLNDALALSTMDSEMALAIYSDLHLAFVRIHPFADGNGRMARLIANLPVLKSGLPPILIERNRRREYLMAISAYDIEVGCAKKDSPLLPDSVLKNTFIHFCKECWQSSIDLVEGIHARQKIRNRNQ
jgi:Fic family protein